MRDKSYWLETPLIEGQRHSLPETASIVVIGSGFTGASAGYFLQRQGFENITIVDDEPAKSASYRNCGHILRGTVESMKAFAEIHGYEKAKELWGYSIELCDLIEQTISDLNIRADYRKDGYLVIAIDEAEDKECQQSTRLLNEAGFESEYISAQEIARLGFKNAYGARFERGCAQAHPVKFRNGILQDFLNRGGQYFSGVNVTSIEDVNSCAIVHAKEGSIKCDAVVIATSAYSPLVSDFFETRRLVEPFRGQIITSQPLRHQFKVTFPHSFDHGYEYALITEDNRLMIGGWRNNVEGGEVGTYDLTPNAAISEGLSDFTQRHYDIGEEIKWEYVWTGIMDASQTSLPFVGPTSSDRIFSCVGYTGHGFSWAHGCAKLLAQIMAGAETPEVAKYFNPKHRLL